MKKADKIKWNTFLFISLGIAINLIMSKFVMVVDCPLYLDTIGTILVAGECGLLPGVITALITNIVAGIFSEDAMYFAIVSVLVAIAAGKMFLKRFHHKKRGLIIMALVLALISGILSSGDYTERREVRSYHIFPNLSHQSWEPDSLQVF